MTDVAPNGLRTPDKHVVYDGHARYGRGPCFATTSTRGDNWETGTDPAAGSAPGAPGVNTGIFRMGYPFLAVPVVMDVLAHGYTVNLATMTDKLVPDLCESQLRGQVLASGVKTWTVGDVDKWLQSKAGQALLLKEGLDPASRLSAQVPGRDVTRPLKYFMASDDGVQPHLVIRGGWNDPTTAPSNIGSTDLNCRVFCHFGCESQKHNSSILRTGAGGHPVFKNWKKSGDRGFAYMTTDLSAGPTTGYWLYHLFTYPKLNNFADWKPSLDYALSKSNSDLDSMKNHSAKGDPYFGTVFNLVEV